jgi:hypothetical protein
MIKTFPRMTTVGAAFVRSAPGPHKLTSMCVNALAKGGHIVRAREWNASLSYGTALALKKQGVLVG